MKQSDRIRRSGIRGLDIVIITASVTLTVGASLYAYSDRDGGYVSVRSGDSEWVYPIDSEMEMSAPGPMGETVVAVSGGTAKIVESPCRDKICISMGPLEHGGDWAACLPNGVLVRIVDERDDEIDALAY